MQRAYAVLDTEGTVRQVVADGNQAIAIARSISPYVSVEAGGETAAPLGDLGRAMSAAEMPALALRLSGLRRLDAREVMALSVQQAHKILLPYFPATRTRKSGAVIKVEPYRTPAGMVEALLGQNYKTGIETPEQPSDVIGLSLMPYGLAAQASKRALPLKGLGLCVGSSDACRKACLVYSGHNTIDLYNIAVKVARTEALLLQPVAFARILVEAVSRHLNSARRRGFEPFIRLNVFSDVPWELVFPDLFGMFPALRFYDYMKVPGRSTPSNYDLTFSWSGVNEAFVQSELQRGRRIAAVFMLPGGMKERQRYTIGPTGKTYNIQLPKTFLNLPVVDGDVSDVRPRNPSPCVVGLRWKLPLGSDAGKRLGNSSFVVPVTNVDGVLVASQAARHESIVDPDVAA